MLSISSLPSNFDNEIQTIIDNKTKPLGALGELEPLAKQLARIQLARQGNTNRLGNMKISLEKPELIVFAGDHGIASEGVSIAPSEVTQQMVANFAGGGAAINVFTQQLGWQLTVVDAGILSPVDTNSQVRDQRLGTITAPIHVKPAMSLAQVEKGFEFAKTLVNEKITAGTNVIAFGEMGIGNTTIAAAIMAAIMKIDAADAVGKGTGVTDDVVIKKQQLIEQALALHQDNLTDAKAILACLGGFEIVQITGAMLAAAQAKVAIVVDGFITTAAALVAIKMEPAVKDYMIFAHCSGEQGHQAMLQWLNVTPLLSLGLRLGEGTGAALALPFLQAAAGFFNQMASFTQANVDNVVTHT